MNSQESALLENFLDNLVQIHGTQKIPQADAMIRNAVRQQPDAAYLLVQRSLILEQALKQAKARIAELELAQQPDRNRNFLDGAASAPEPMARAAPTAAPPAGAVMPSEPSRGSGAGSFLGQAAATAAGVAGGAFLFEGIESLFGAHGASPGQTAQSFIPEDVTINNYYAGDEPHARASDESDRFTDVDDGDSDFDSGDDDGDFV